MKHLFICILLSSFIFQACKSTTSMTSSDILTAHNWELTHIMGEEISSDDFMAKMPTLTFMEGGDFASYTGCNNLNGTFKADGNTMTLSPGPMTRKACPGNGEQRVIDAMNKVNGFEFNGDELHLMDANLVLLRYKKM